MELAYYPGCTIKTRARNFEESAIAAMSALDVRLTELPRWNCCGTVYSLSEDDLVHHVAAVRNLVRVRQTGASKVVTLCSFCYNTLHRANQVMKDSADKRYALNTFMDEEPDYAGEVRVSHLLQVLRDDVGWERVSQRVSRPLNGLKVAGYYGCTLLRPASCAIDIVERPTVLQGLVTAIGATPIEFPFATECCGAYQVVNNRDIVNDRTLAIVASARRNGAEVLAVSCPLCEYNLRQSQAKLTGEHAGFVAMPLVYFTQLMAIAFGLDAAVCRFEDNSADTRAWIAKRGLVA